MMQREYLKSVSACLCAVVVPLQLAGSATAQQTEYSYDALGRLIKTEYNQVDTVEYAYDAAGNRQEVNVSINGVSVVGAIDDVVPADFAAMSIIRPLDNDAGGVAPITVSAVSVPLNGVAVIAANGEDIEYTPNAGFQGEDSFTYTSTDASTATSQATVTVTVQGPVVFDIAGDANATEGTGVEFTVTKTGSALSTQTVDIATAIGTADGTDFTQDTQTLSFASGETSKTFTVSTSDDSDFEMAEDFSVALSNPSSGAALGTATTRTGTINDNDSVSIAIDDVSAVEGGDLSFTVSLSGASPIAHDVSYVAEVGSGTGDVNDFVATSDVLTFNIGETSKSVVVSTVDDASFEGDETINLSLSAPTGGATIATSTGVGTITENDAGPSFAVDDVSVTEGTALAFTISMTGTSTASHDVSYASGNDATATNAADAGADYTAVSGTLTFAAGETSKTVSIPTIQEAIHEKNELMWLDLTAATNSATISDSQGIGTITNDDAAPAFSVNNRTRTEGQNLTFTITKTGATEKTHRVDYRTINDTAIAGSDYTAKSGYVQFPYNVMTKTVTILSNDDSHDEPQERFKFRLENPTSQSTISDNTGIARIDDNDPANSPPNAVTDVVAATLSIPKYVYPLANDTDANGHTITLTSQSPGSGVVTSWNASAKRLTVTGTLTGGRIVNYSISDGHGGTDTGLIQVNVSGGGGGGGGGGGLPLF